MARGGQDPYTAQMTDRRWRYLLFALEGLITNVKARVKQRESRVSSYLGADVPLGLSSRFFLMLRMVGQDSCSRESIVRWRKVD